MNAAEQLHRDADSETEIAAAAAARVLREHRPTAEDILNGGAGIRAKLEAARQTEEQRASDRDGVKRECAIRLAKTAERLMTAYQALPALLVNLCEMLEEQADARRSYDSAFGHAAAAGVLMPKRIPPITVLAQNDAELELRQLLVRYRNATASPLV